MQENELYFSFNKKYLLLQELSEEIADHQKQVDDVSSAGQDIMKHASGILIFIFIVKGIILQNFSFSLNGIFKVAMTQKMINYSTAFYV